MNIHRALSDIAEIRAQLDRTETYRGFRSAAVGVSVALLALGTWVQSIWIVDFSTQINRYLTVWFAVAIASAAIAAIEMLVRSRVSENQMVGKMHWSLVRHISSSLFVGFALTALIVVHAHELSNSPQPTTEASLVWALPGLWSMVYSLGLLNCRHDLPAPAIGVAGYFLFAGATLLACNWWTRELQGWEMLASFGVGQAYLAGVLFWNLERRRG